MDEPTPKIEKYANIDRSEVHVVGKITANESSKAHPSGSVFGNSLCRVSPARIKNVVDAVNSSM